MNKIFLSVLSLFLIVFISTNLTLAQSGSSTSTTTKSASTPIVENNVSGEDIKAYFNSLEAPKIIKNNVRANNVVVTKAIINSNNELEIEGTVEIKNYADTETSKLYMISYTGIKGSGYYLEYPLYNEERSEAFVLKPKESINKNFKIVEKNFINWGMGAVEIMIEDEYNKMVHKEIGILPYENFINIKKTNEIFTEIESRLVVGDETFPLGSGPTFEADKEDMFIKLDFGTTTPDFIDSFDITVYERNFFTRSIKEFNVEAEYDDENLITIQIPEDLNAGVYPFQIISNTNNGNYIPRIYGRFIVAGNMGKTIDASLNLDGKKAVGLILTIQGNPPNMSDINLDQTLKFDAEVTVLGQGDKVLFTKKVDNQSVEIYRNIDISLDDSINASKIKKVKVTLSDENGVFNVFEKEYDLGKSFNYWNIFYVLIGILILFVLIKIKNKHNLTAVFVILLVFGFANSVYAVEPSNSLGVFLWDADSSLYREDTDIQVLEGTDLLTYFGINLNVTNPNPNVCYAPGQLIPVTASLSYDVCENSPIQRECTGTGSCEYSASPYLSFRLPYDSTTWFHQLRSWNFNGPGIDGVSYPEEEDMQHFELQYIKDYLSSAMSTNSDTYNTTNHWWLSIFANTGYYYSPIMKYPYYGSYYDADIDMSGWAGSAQEELSLIAPEKPGTYKFILSLDFNAKNGGNGYYLGEYTVNVCDTIHDSDFLMPGIQNVDQNGNLLDGYNVQKYVWGESLISGFPEENLAYGSNNDPDNETAFLSLSNYCAENRYNSYPETLTGVFDFYSNHTSNWANLLSTFWDSNRNFTKLESTTSPLGENWNKISEFLYNMPTKSETIIPYFSFKQYGGRYLANRKDQLTYLNFDNPYDSWAQNNPYLVHKVNGELRFLDVAYYKDYRLPYKRNDGGAELSKAYNTDSIYNSLVSESKNIYEMFTGGYVKSLNYYNTDVTITPDQYSDLYLIKENLTDADDATSCSLYVDFCKSVNGVQYLLNNYPDYKMELWYLDSNNNHVFATSTPYNSLIATVDSMCTVPPPVVAPTALSATCTTSVGGSATTTAAFDQEVTFTISASGGDTASSYVYNFSFGDGTTTNNVYSKTYDNATYNVGDNSATVFVYNSTSSISVVCPLNLIDQPPVVTELDLQCSASPSNVKPGESVTFSATTTGGTPSYVYSWGAGGTGSGNSQTYIVPDGASVFSKQVDVSDNSSPIKNDSESCSVNIKSCGSAVTGSYASEPINNLCLYSSPSGVTFNGTSNEWEWTCDTTISCFADFNDGVPNLDVKLKVQPKIYPSCKAKFDGTNLILTSTETCELLDPTGFPIETYGTSTDLTNRTFDLDDKGVYTLKCYEIGNSIPKITSTDVCISNPVIIEQ
jgi:hypothetical protein